MGTFRGLITLALLVAFLVLVVWLFLVHRHKDFDAAARIPLEDSPATDNTDPGNRNE